MAKYIYRKIHNAIDFIYIQIIYLLSTVESKNNNIFCLKSKILATLCIRTLEDKNIKFLKMYTICVLKKEEIILS